MPTSDGSQKKPVNSRNAYTSASLTTLKPLTVWITTNWGKFRKRWEYQTTLPVLGIFSPGLGSDEPERRTLGQSLARTDKFISAVKLFYRSRNKELKYMVSRVHTELTHNQYKHFKDSVL